MTQIADAPRIREAELYGMPPYEDNSEFEDASDKAAKELEKADRLADDIVSALLNAEEFLTGFESDYDEARKMNERIRELIYTVEGIGCDFRSFAQKMKDGR